MLVPVILIAVMVARVAAHSFNTELVNGTMTITINDFDKACENFGFIRHGELKIMTEKMKEGDASRDTESWLRSVLEKFCPIVEYIPIKEYTEKDEPITEKVPIGSKYHVDDKIVHSKISDTTEKSRDVLINSTSELTSATESIIKSTNKTDEIISDIKVGSHGYENVTESTLTIGTKSIISTPSYKNNSIVYEKGEKFVEKNATTKTLDKPGVLTSTMKYTDLSMNITSDTKMSEKDEPTAKKEPLERIKYHTVDKTTKNITSSVHFNISDTTEKNRDVIYSTSKLTSSTESIIKSTNKSDEIIAEKKFESHDYENVTKSIVTIETKSTSDKYRTFILDEKEIEFDEKNATAKAIVKPDILRTTVSYPDLSINTTASPKMSEKVLSGTLKTLITTTEPVKINSTLINTGTKSESTKTTLHDTLVEPKMDCGKENSTAVTTVTITTKAMTPEPKSYSFTRTVKDKTEELSLKENITNTTPIVISEVITISTVSPTEKNTTEDRTVLFFSSSKKNDEAVEEKDSVFKNKTKDIEEPEHKFDKHENTSDYSSEEDTIEAIPTETDYTTINDAIIVPIVDEVTEITSAKFNKESKATTIIDTDYAEDYDEKDEDIDESSEMSRVKTGTTTKIKETTESAIHEDKIEKKLIYEHDTSAVDERRLIVVILFVSILLILILIWAVQFLYRRHKGSYVLPQEAENDMELGDNSTENQTK